MSLFRVVAYADRQCAIHHHYTGKRAAQDALDAFMRKNRTATEAWCLLAKVESWRDASDDHNNLSRHSLVDGRWVAMI